MFLKVNGDPTQIALLSSKLMMKISSSVIYNYGRTINILFKEDFNASKEQALEYIFDLGVDFIHDMDVVEHNDTEYVEFLRALNFES